ncbi:hypothetical protein RIF29_29769 [Crotalaria pallida]|uniref:Uncharacterized protein n=1 Tax=Crotalaria pallida TaxID=3830 RepID=A0AAN9HW65_CROPI
MGLLSVWNAPFLGYPARAILPYSRALEKLAPHIQQGGICLFLDDPRFKSSRLSLLDWDFIYMLQLIRGDKVVIEEPKKTWHVASTRPDRTGPALLMASKRPYRPGPWHGHRRVRLLLLVADNFASANFSGIGAAFLFCAVWWKQI